MVTQGGPAKVFVFQFVTSKGQLVGIALVCQIRSLEIFTSWAPLITYIKSYVEFTNHMHTQTRVRLWNLEFFLHYAKLCLVVCHLQNKFWFYSIMSPKLLWVHLFSAILSIFNPATPKLIGKGKVLEASMHVLWMVV